MNDQVNQILASIDGTKIEPEQKIIICICVLKIVIQDPYASHKNDLTAQGLMLKEMINYPQLEPLSLGEIKTAITDVIDYVENKYNTAHTNHQSILEKTRDRCFDQLHS